MSPVRGTVSPHSRWSRTVTGQAGPRPRRGTARGCVTDIRAGLPPCRPLSFADAHLAPVKPPDPPGDIAGLRHERKIPFHRHRCALRGAGPGGRLPVRHAGLLRCAVKTAFGRVRSLRGLADAPLRSPASPRDRPPSAHTSLRSVPYGTGRLAGAAHISRTIPAPARLPGTIGLSNPFYRTIPIGRPFSV